MVTFPEKQENLVTPILNTNQCRHDDTLGFSISNQITDNFVNEPLTAACHETSGSITKPLRNKSYTNYNRQISSVATSYTATYQQYANNNPTNSKLISSAHYGQPSSRHSFTSDVKFSHIYIHLVTSAYLTQLDQDSLDACHPAYKYLSTMMQRIRLNLIYKLSKDNPDYATQQSIPYYRCM